MSKLTTMEYSTSENFDMRLNQCISQYVKQNQHSTNTELFSLLALLNAYVPESYLLMSECQQVLGPPDPIHGGPPFEKRMGPFTGFINTSTPGNVCMIDQMCAQRAVELLAQLGIHRSATVKRLFSLCGDQAQPHTIQFIKHLLTKREMGENGKNKFSQLIKDIYQKETFQKAVSVLKIASDKFRTQAIYLQTISRLHIPRDDKICESVFLQRLETAKSWAKKAIERAPVNSYVADTLGQVHKKHLMMEPEESGNILHITDKALKAFKDVEMKAEREEGPEIKDIAVSTSNSFNNRGLFGFIQVAKLALDKLPAEKRNTFILKTKMEVEAKFDFFEWYLTYSKPSMRTSEPPYFWKDVALCYQNYTTRTAAESTSFPGLFDCLNHGLFRSKGRRAKFKQNEKTVSELKAIQEVLKTTYEENVEDVNIAERYILSNIILSNRTPGSPHLTPVRELQTIIHRFLGTNRRQRSPEFCLLVLLLFWPEEQPQVVQQEDDEEVDQQATEDNASDDKTWDDEDSNEEQETRGEPAQLPLDLMFEPDLQQYVTFMEKAFERGKYAKYLRGRYLLPLFFLGKGSGLSKWIHKSRLDAIVERKVDAKLADQQHNKNKKKVRRINNMWTNGEVWQVPEIQNILLPVSVEPCHSLPRSQEHEEQEMFVCAGGKKIKVSIEDDSGVSPMLFYLGFTIRGPVLFKVGVPHSPGR